MKRAAWVAALIVLLALATWRIGFAPGESPEPPPSVAPQPPPPSDSRAATPSGPSLAKAPAGFAAATKRFAPSADAAATGAAFVGRVIDGATGRAIEGARVVLANQFARRDGEPAAESAADGAFRVADVKPGEADSCLVEADGYAWARVELSNAARSASAGTTQDLGDVRLIRGAVVRGRVVASPGGGGISGATLLLSDGAGGGFAPAFARDVGRTDDAGRFTIEHVPPVAHRSAWVLFAVSGEGIGWVALPSATGKEDVGEVEVAMRPTGTLAVRAEDAAGKAVSKAAIRLEPNFQPLGGNGGHSMWFGERPDVLSVLEGETNAQGVARFERLPVGDDGHATFDVVAYARGFVLSWRDGVQVTHGEEASATVMLTPYRAASLSGTVREKGGGPVAGTAVSVGGERRAVTGVDGSFRVTDLDPSYGRTSVRVEAAGYVPVQREVRLRVDADPSDQVFVLVKAAPIEGRVVDQNGRPVLGARLDVRVGDDETDQPGTTTDADGRFLFPYAMPGAWTMQVAAPEPDDLWLEEAFDVPVHGGDRTVEVALTRIARGGARIRAVVVDVGTGTPLTPTEGALMPVGAAERGRVWRPPAVVADATGLTAENVKPGPWLFWARVPDRPPAFSRVDVREGDRELSARIEVGRAGALAGRVEFPDGHRASPAAVHAELRDSDAGAPWQGERPGRGFARLAGDGSFRLEGLMPGAYRIVLSAHGFLGSADAEVASGVETAVVVKAAAAGVLRFRSESPMPEAIAEFYVAYGDGPMEQVMRLGGLTGKPLDYHQTVRPGRVRWRVRFEAGDGSGVRAVGGALPAAADGAEGEVEARAGETLDVTVPIVLR